MTTTDEKTAAATQQSGEAALSAIVSSTKSSDPRRKPVSSPPPSDGAVGGSNITSMGFASSGQPQQPAQITAESAYANLPTNAFGQQSEPSSAAAFQPPAASMAPLRDAGPDVKTDGKMFIGGLNWDTTEDSLRNYFSQYGEVVDCSVMRDTTTMRSRGFGFLTFKDAKCVNEVMLREHYLDGKMIDPKRAIPRDEQEKTVKIFVGGIPQDISEEEFKEFFEQYGEVVDATLMLDKETGRPRGFGFITFAEEASCNNVLVNGFIQMRGKQVEVKLAQPKGRDIQPTNRRNDQFYNSMGTAGQFNPMMGAAAAAGGGAGAAGGAPGGMYPGMTPALMAQYFQNMQKYMAAMQQNMGRGGMMINPAMMYGMNPQMMQQMQQQQPMMQPQGDGTDDQAYNSPLPNDGSGTDDLPTNVPTGPKSGSARNNAPSRGSSASGNRGGNSSSSRGGSSRFNPYGR